jgi:hypothetical protein
LELLIENPEEGCGAEDDDDDEASRTLTLKQVSLEFRHIKE